MRTRFGFHIIKAEDRRGGGKPNYESAKNKIKKQLLETRRKQALLSHVKDLRNKEKVIIYMD